MAVYVCKFCRREKTPEVGKTILDDMGCDGCGRNPSRWMIPATLVNRPETPYAINASDRRFLKSIHIDPEA